MRRALTLFALAGVLLLGSLPALAQATAANYTFATTTTGSLVDMSSGTTTLVAASSDDTQSAVANIGFDFYFKSVRFSQFSATSNGLLVLGTSTGFGATYSMASAASTWLGACVADQRTTATGKVHYKVTGAAPNRVLVVEWSNMYSYWSSTGETADYTYQALLYETTGAVEFLYGGMTMSTAAAASETSQSPQIGFSWGTSAGSVGAVTAPQAGSPTYDGTTGAVVDNLYVTGAITVLTSAADGSRRTMLMTPPVPTAPTGMNFTGVGQTAMTVNWTDAADELAYAVYRSTDGVNYTYQTTLPAGTTSYGATGLNPGTTYHFQVFSVSEGALSAALSGNQATAPAGTPVSVASGLWSNPATWSTGLVPTAGDNVTIADGHTVTIDTAAVAYTLTVGQGASGVLEFETGAARTLTVTSDVTVASGGTFQTGAAGTVTTHGLSVGGNLTNNGTIDFSTNGDTAGAMITFTGEQNATFGGSGATTDIRGITVNKGTTPSSILELMPSAFTVRGVTTDTVAGGWLVMTNGTLKLSGTFTGTSRVFATAGYTIPVSFGFWLNNPNYTVAGQNASPTVNGQLRITQGTYNVGTGSGNSLGLATGSTVIVEGGAVNTSGRFAVNGSSNTINYSQSGGTITTCTVGNASGTYACFDLGTSLASNIAISGGTIVVQLASTAASGPRDYRHQAGNGYAGVTGGTLQLGNASSGGVQAYDLRGVLPNLVISNASAGHTATMDTNLVNYNNLAAGNITINPGTTFNINNLIFLMAGSTVTNDGTLTANGASSRFYWYGVAGIPQTYTGSGVTTAPITSWDLDNAMGLTHTSTNQVVTTRVIVFTGSITGADKITLGNGGTTAGTVQIGNTTTPTDAGTFDVPMTFNLGTGGQNISYLRTSASRTTGGEVNPTRVLNNLTYDDNDATHTLTVDGGDLTVNGTPTLTNGRVITGANNLVIGGTGAVTRTNGYVDGNLRKNYTAAGSKTYEVGTANGYTPVVFNATAGTFPADVTVKATETAAPGFSPASLAITRYWTLTASGVTADVTFSYLDPTDIPGTVTEADLHVWRNDGTFTDLGGTVDTTLNTAQVTGVSTFSDWTLANAVVPATATVSGDATICTGGSTDIQAALTGTGPWDLTWSDTFVQNGVTSSPAIRSVSPSSTTVYTVTSISDSLGAGTASGSATVTVNPTPAAPTAGNDGPACEGGTVNLTASTVAGATYAWTGPNGFASTDQNPVLTNVQSADAGLYSVTATVAGCPSPAGTTTVVVNPVPVAPTAGSEATVCQGETIHLTASDVTGGTYTWTGPDGFVSATQNPVITNAQPAASGVYSVTVTVDGCTSAPATTTTTVTPDSTAPVVTPPADVVVFQTLCCGTFGGADSDTSATLATFLAGGSATDDCTATALAPQVGGVDVTGTTCFEVGTTPVTFRFSDAAGNVGTAAANVTVRMYGDLDLTGTVDPADMVVLQSYFNFAATPGVPPFGAPLDMADLTHDTLVDPADMVQLQAYFNFAVSCLAP